MHFGLVTAHPRRDWHSRRLAEACARRGEVDIVRPTDLALRDGTVRVRGEDTRRFDVWILARALGRHGDPDFQCALYRGLSTLGFPVLNPIDALLTAEDKAATSFLLARAGVPTPRFIAVQRLSDARAALAEFGVAVAKPPYGSLGIGVERIAADEASAKRRLTDRLERYGVLYLQDWVGRAPAEDYRIFVVGGDVAAAMARTAPDGEFRTNVYQGGRPRPIQPTAAQCRVAVAAARQLGLEYAGVDVVETADGPTIIEVNGTPSWRTLYETTGLDMADAIVARAVALADRGLDAEAPRPQHPTVGGRDAQRTGENEGRERRHDRRGSGTQRRPKGSGRARP